LCLKGSWSDFDPQAYDLYGEDQNHETSFKGKALQAVVDSWCKIQVIIHTRLTLRYTRGVISTYGVCSKKTIKVHSTNRGRRCSAVAVKPVVSYYVPLLMTRFVAFSAIVFGYPACSSSAMAFLVLEEPV
jgi:hypothetical protein